MILPALVFGVGAILSTILAVGAWRSPDDAWTVRYLRKRQETPAPNWWPLSAVAYRRGPKIIGVLAVTLWVVTPAVALMTNSDSHLPLVGVVMWAAATAAFAILWTIMSLSSRLDCLAPPRFRDDASD